MTNVENALNLKQELDSLRPLKKEDELRVMQKFRLDWNYHSNHLEGNTLTYGCLLYTSPSPRDKRQSRMPSSA